MKDVIKLSAEKREDTGTRASRRLRGTGKVPCVVYGHKEDPVTLAVDHHDLGAAVRHHTRMLDLNLEGAKAERVLLADVQHDIYNTRIIHADFIRIAMDEMIRVPVSVELRGSAQGEQHGGVTEQLLDEVEVECLPGDIPEAIPLVVTELDVGDSVHVGQLETPEQVKIVTDPSYLVVTVALPKKHEEEEAAPEEAEAAAEPELIGEREEEEETQEEEAGEESPKSET